MSDTNESPTKQANKINSFYGFRTFKKFPDRLPSTLKVIKSDNMAPEKKDSEPNILPKISVYNARSLFPKIESFCTEMLERETDVSFVSEIWEQRKNTKHNWKIKEMLELKGIKYISNPRCGKRGGGAAIAANLKKFTLSKLNVHIPKGVETV